MARSRTCDSVIRCANRKEKVVGCGWLDVVGWFGWFGWFVFFGWFGWLVGLVGWSGWFGWFGWLFRV